MTDSLFFDSDCISAFLWVKEQNLLGLLFPGKIIIPKAAYDELSFPTTMGSRCIYGRNLVMLLYDVAK